MRACTTANAIFFGIVVAAATFAACSGSGTSPQASPPPGTSTSDPAGDPELGAGSAADGQGVAPVGESAAAKPAQKQPETVADCKELATDITNEPPAGAVPMNNATAPGDGGTTSDRLQPMVDTMKSNRDKFRCCFDLWARKNPGAAGRVVLRVKLNPDGKLTTSEVVEKDTTVAAPEVHACMLEVAKSLAYPKSPSGKDTTYTHPFDFKARR